MGFLQASNGIDSKSTISGSGDIVAVGDLYSKGMDNTTQNDIVGYNTSNGKLTYFKGYLSTFTTSSVYSGGSQITFSPTSSYNVYSLNNTNDSNVSITLTKNAALPVGSPITLAVSFTASNIDPLCTLSISYDKGASNINLLFNSGSTANYVATFVAHNFNGGGFVNTGFIQTS